MKKILLMVPSLNKGGAENVVIDLINSLNGKCDLILFAFFKSTQEKYNAERLNKNTKLIYLFNFPVNHNSFFERTLNFLTYMFAPFLALMILKIIRDEKINIVHANMSLSSFYLPKLKFLCWLTRYQCKFVDTFHTNWHLLKFYNKIIFPYSWIFADKVVYEIGDNENKVIQKFSASKKIYNIPFAIQTAEDCDLEFKKNLFRKHSIPNNKIILGTISRLRIFEKKIDKMLILLKNLNQYDDNYFLVLFGDGPDKESIYNLARQLGVDKNFLITGFVDKPEQVVYSIDIFLVAMVENYTGIAGLQAGISKIPCFGIQTKEKFKYSLNSKIEFSDNMPELAARIQSHYEKQTLKEYSNIFYEHILKNHNINAFSNSYLKIYHDL